MSPVYKSACEITSDVMCFGGSRICFLVEAWRPPHVSASCLVCLVPMMDRECTRRVGIGQCASWRDPDQGRGRLLFASAVLVQK